jgi:tRNA-Thr(GGU) m(6)t(6)A37 methyltransferase TsaA
VFDLSESKTMATSRRAFVAEAAFLAAAGGTILTSNAMAAEDESVKAEGTEAFYKVYPIGKVEKKDASTRIRIFDKYADGLVGLDQWSHVNVFYWFDKNDVPQKRRILQVHPRGDRKNPLTGVFACRAPVRPNLVALTVCKILSVEKNVLTVDRIDAFDATPVIDLKPFIPPDAPSRYIKVPGWTGRKKRDE